MECKKAEKKDDSVSSTKSKKVMSSNLPLLMASGRPRSLDTISQPELEDFVPFMILCSLGQEQHKKPFKEINNCPIPEWWPQGFPFKYPLVEQSHWTNRQVMLRSLVCRCYTFYNCEFLLKFSSQLAEMPPSQLNFHENKDENTTSIYDANGCVLVKCRNENLNYDMHKSPRRYLSPSPNRPTLSPTKKFNPVIDLTFDTSSEDEKEVYFKEPSAAVSVKSAKRKANFERSDESKAKQRCLRRICVRRIFEDFPKEEPEPEFYSQEEMMMKLGLVGTGKEDQLPRAELKVEKKKRLAHSFSILSVTSTRGQQLLKQNRNSVNVEACLERIQRLTATDDHQQELFTEHVSTRASLTYGLSPDAKETSNSDEEQNGSEHKWCHVYKWPHRTRRAFYLHRGPSIKPCSVVIIKLSQEMITMMVEGKRNQGVSTPPVWWLHNASICHCQKIPLIELDVEDDDTQKKDKSTSTRCTCTVPTMPKLVPFPQQTSSRSYPINLKNKPKPPALIEINPGFSSGSSVSSRIISPSSDGGPTVVSSYPERQTSSPVSFKRVSAVHRRPLAVVLPFTVDLEQEHGHAITESKLTSTCVDTLSTNHIKVKLNKSIADAISWYTKDDPVIVASDISNSLNKSFVKGKEHTRENIEPLTSVLDFNVFKLHRDVNDRDVCYTRMMTESGTKPRRGIQHRISREPCVYCFQGKDNICVYEYIRQAKLAGVPLQQNEKQLQQLFSQYEQYMSN